MFVCFYMCVWVWVMAQVRPQLRKASQNAIGNGDAFKFLHHNLTIFIDQLDEMDRMILLMFALKVG